jgi:hypothetical protein
VVAKPIKLSPWQLTGFRFIQPTLHHWHNDIGRASDLCQHLSVHHRGDDPRQVEVLPVDVRPPKVAIAHFTLKNRTIGPVARLFVEYAREVARPLSRIRG